MPDELSLSTLKPASPRKARKRVGRGMGSGKGRYAGRGVKGQKARAGSHKMRAGFEGGQMPIYMRLGKQRGATSKDAMPIGPHRTVTQSVNVRDLERVFEAGAEVTPETLKERRLIRSVKIDVKILGQGELTKKLTVTAHRFSATAREKIEALGGSAIALREGNEAKTRKRRKLTAAKRASGILPASSETGAEVTASTDAEAEAPEDRDAATGEEREA